MGDPVSIYLLVLAGIVPAQLAPGPNLVAVAGVALGEGRRNAAFVAFGVATAIFIWVSLSAFGLAAVIAVFPPLMTAMKILGGGYLLFLAIKSARAALSGAPPRFNAGEEAPRRRRQAFRRGLLVNLTNPKSAMMWAAVATFMIGAGLTPWQVMAFAPIGFASAFAVYGSYAVLFSSAPARRAYSRFAKVFEGVFAAAFGVLGGQLVVSGIREAGR